MAELIEKHGINIFLDISINKVVSNLGLKNYVSDKDEYQNFSSFIKSLLDGNYEIKEKNKKFPLFSLFKEL